MRRVYGKGVLGYSSRDGRLTRNGDDRKTQYSRPAVGAPVGVAEEEVEMLAAERRALTTFFLNSLPCRLPFLFHSPIAHATTHVQVWAADSLNRPLPPAAQASFCLQGAKIW
jgi:hypothetical protein